MFLQVSVKGFFSFLDTHTIHECFFKDILSSYTRFSATSCIFVLIISLNLVTTRSRSKKGIKNQIVKKSTPKRGNQKSTPKKQKTKKESIKKSVSKQSQKNKTPKKQAKKSTSKQPLQKRTPRKQNDVPSQPKQKRSSRKQKVPLFDQNAIDTSSM